jgi:hypothetical protein
MGHLRLIGLVWCDPACLLQARDGSLFVPFALEIQAHTTHTHARHCFSGCGPMGGSGLGSIVFGNWDTSAEKGASSLEGKEGKKENICLSQAFAALSPPVLTPRRQSIRDCHPVITLQRHNTKNREKSTANRALPIEADAAESLACSGIGECSGEMAVSLYFSRGLLGALPSMHAIHAGF